MKIVTHILKRAGALLALFLIMTGLRAQAPTYLCELRNDLQVDAKTFEFDIYLLRTGATVFEYSSMQFGININPAVINGGTISVSLVSGSSQLNGSQIPASNKFSFDADLNCIIMTGTPGPGAGSGTIISNSGSGTRVGRIRITNSANFATFAPNLVWSYSLSTGYITKVNAYISGSSGEITVQASQTISNLLNLALNPIITPFNVTGTGSYCLGGLGLPVGLDDSQSAVTYTLFKDGFAQPTTVAGTGSAISFGNQLAGTYTVTGMNVNGTVNMTGSAVLSIAANPVAPTISLIQPDCNVATGTITVTAPTGMNYSINGSDYSNTTGVFSGVVPGTYSVTDRNAAGCTSSGTTAVINTQTVLPAIPGAITGLATVCPGVTGLTYSISAVPGADSYIWSLPPTWNITAGGTGTSITVTSGGAGQNGNISVLAHNNCGNSASRNLAVTVSPGTPATPGSITGTTGQCPLLAGQTYSISAVPGATTYTWLVPSGWVINSGTGTASITVTTGVNGANGNISVTAGNTCGISSASTLAVTVGTISTAPTGINIANNNTCSSTTKTLTISGGTLGTGASWQWYTASCGGTLAGTGTSIDVTPPAGSSTVYYVRAAGTCNTTTCASGTVVVSENVGLPSTPAPSETTICQGSSNTVYTTSAPYASAYVWSVSGSGNTISGVGTTGTVTWAPGFFGPATVSVSATGCNGSSPSASTGVTVRPSPSATISGGATVCQNAASPAVTISNPGALPVTVTYNINGTVQPTLNIAAGGNSVINAPTTSAGTFNYNLVSVVYQTAPTCSRSISGTSTINVNALPNATLTSTDTDNIFCAGTSVMFSVPAGASNYNFRVGASSVQNGSGRTYTTTSLTNGQVVDVVVTSAASCVSTSTGITNFVNPLPFIFISTPATCAPNLLSYSLAVSVSTGTVTSTAGTVVNSGGNVWTISAVPAGIGITITVIDPNSCQNTLAVAAPNCGCPVIQSPLSGGDKSYCSGGLVPTINATVSAGETVDWYSAASAGTLLQLNSLTYTPAAAGTYYALARNISSGCGSSTRTAVTVTMNPLPSAGLSSSDADNSFCAGTSVTFTGSGGVLYNFRIGATSMQNGASATYTTSSLTTGQIVSVFVTDANGCSATSAGLTNTVNPLPVPTLASNDANNTICTGASVIFTAGGGGAGATYNFRVGGSSVQSGTLNAYTTTTLTNGQFVDVVVTTSNSCVATSTGIVTTVNSLPSPTITSSDPDNTFCAGTSVTFTAGGGTSFSFRVGASTVQNGSSPTYTTSSLTNGQVVSVIVTDGNGCSAVSAGISNTVNTLPAPTITSSDGNNSFCAGTTITFTANGGPSYNFRVGGVSVQNGTSAEYTTSSLTNGQVVDVVVTNGNGCVAASSGITNNVVALPNATLVSSDGDNIFCSGTSITFTAGGGSNYNFRVGGSSVQNGASATYTTSTLTNGQIIDVIVTNAGTCISTSPAITNFVNILPFIIISSAPTCSPDLSTYSLVVTVSSGVVTSTFGTVVNTSGNVWAVSGVPANTNTTIRVTDGNSCQNTLVVTYPNCACPVIAAPVSGGNREYCSGSPIPALTASVASGETIDWFSNSSGGTPLASGTLSYTPAAAGTYYAMTRNTTSGCVSSTRTAVTATMNPLPVVTLTSSETDNSFCIGTTITFTAGGGTLFNFRVGGISVQNSGSATYTTSSLSNGQVVDVIVTNGKGCVATSSGINNTVFALPNPTLTSSDADNTFCTGSAITFTAGGGSNYNFRINGTSVQSGTSSTYATSSLTNGQVVDVVVTNSNLCVAASATITNTVNGLPSPSLISSDTDNTFCLGASITFTAGGGTSYDFRVGASVVQSGASAVYTTNSLTNSQVVSVIVTNANGCSSISSGIANTVNALPTPSLTSSDADNSFCIGSSVTFTAIGGTSYTFRVNGSNVQSGVSPTYTTSSLSNGQVVDVIAVNSNGCAGTSSGLTNTVFALPSATITSSDADNIFCAGSVITFTGSGGTNYNFRVGGVSVQNGGSSTYTTSSLTNGQIIDVIVTSAAGCVAVSPVITNFVNILPFIIITSPPTCSPDLSLYSLIINVSSGTVTSTSGTVTNTGGNVWSITGVASGTNITLRVTDGNGCENVLVVTAPNCNCPVTLAPVSGGNRAYCIGGTVPTVTASVSAGETVDWYNASSGGTILRSGSLSYTPAGAGTFHALTRNTTSGCVSSTRTAITVTQNPLPVVTISSSEADNTFCIGTSITFTATGGTNYNFRVGGTSVQNGASANYTTSSLTNGQVVSVLVTNENACSATSTGITNTVTPLPTATITSSDPDNIFCSGTSVTFTGGGGTSYNFRVAGVSVQNGSTPVYTSSSITNGQVVDVVVTNSNGCIATSSSITNTVNILPAAFLSSSDVDNTFCIGTSVTFTAGGGAGYTFRIGGANVQSGASSTYSTSSLTNGQVVDVVVTNSNGCISVSSGITNTVNPLPLPSLSSSDVNNSFCTGTSITFTGSGGVSYNFRIGSTSVQNGSSPTYTTSSLTNGQVVSVIVTNENGCSATSTGITNTVNLLPVPVLSSSDSDNSFCAGTSVTFTAGGGTSYNFRIGGTSVQNGSTSTYTTNSLTNGQIVDVVVTNSNGCLAVSSPIINTVNALPTPTLTSSDPDNIFCTGTSITFTTGGGTSYTFRVGGVTVQSGATAVYTTSSLINGQVVDVVVSNSNGCVAVSPGISNTVNPLPTPSIISSDANNIFCSGTSVTFTAGGGTDYNFRVGGSSVQNGNSNSFTTSSLTNGQIVDVIVTNSNSCSAISTGITNTVQALPVSTIVSSDPDNTFCSGNTITFTGGGGTLYNFRVNGTSVQNGSSSTYVTAGLTNGQSIDVIVTNAGGCSTTSASIVNTVNSLPSPALISSDPDNIFCAGTAVTFTAGGGTGYNFRVGGVSVQNGAPDTFTTTTLTNGQPVDVIVINANGCVSTSAAIINTVRPLPAPTLTSSDSDNRFCAGSSIIFTAGGGTNYNFRVNGVTVQNGSATTYSTSSLTDGQSVDVIVTNSNGCIATSSSLTNIVFALPTPNLVSSDADNIFCAGASVTFSGSGGLGYNFRVNGVTVQNGASANYTTSGLTNGQVVDLIVTNTNGCSALTDEITNSVNPLPTPALTSSDPDNRFCIGSSVTFTAGGGLLYNFRVAGVSVQSGASDTFTTSSLTNGQAVSVIVTNGNACSSTSAGIINTVYALPAATLTSTDPDNILCAGSSVTFTGGGGTNYNFNLGGVSVQSGALASYTTSSINNGQTINVIVTNANGCTSTSPSITNFVNALPFIIITSPPICAVNLLTYSLTITVSSGTVTSTAGSVANTGGNIWTITGVPSGTNITIRVLDSNGCDNTLVVTAPNCNCPVVFAPVSGGDKEYCSGSPIPALSATVLAGETVDWYNASSGGTLLASGSLTYTPSGAGTFYAIAKNITTNCVSSTRTPVRMVMNPLPIVSLTSSDADNTFCLGTSITFTGGSGTAYDFRVGGVSVQNSVSSTYTTSSLTNGQVVSVIVTNENSCVATSPVISNTVRALPIPVLSSSDADNSFCAGATVAFTASGGISYNFRIGGSSMQSGPSATFSTNVLTNGQIVDVIVTNANGCIATSSGITNTVNPIPLPVLSSSDPDNIFCLGTSVTFTAGGGSSYNFRVGGSSVQNGTTNTYTTSALTNGSTVDVVVTSSAGCVSTSSEITNTVNALPAPLLVSSDGDNRFCAGTSVTFTAGGGVLYNFRIDGSSVQSGSSATYTTSSLTNGQVADVVVTDANGCISISSGIPNTIYALPVPTLTSSDTDNRFCSGTSVTFTAGGGSSYNFRISGLSVQSGTAASYSTSTLTNGQVVDVIVTNANGCLATSAGIVNIVNSLPVPALLSSDTDNIFCAGTSVTFTSGGGTTYYFRVDGVSIQIGESDEFTTSTLTNGQVVDVLVTNSEGCTAISAGITNTVNPIPLANPGTGGDECDLNFRLSAVPSIGTGVWTWSSGPGSAIFEPDGNTAAGLVTVSDYGTYTFTWTETSNNCTASSVITVNFYQQPVANAGTGGNNCGLDFFMKAVPSTGIGTWTHISGPGTVTFTPDASSPNAMARVTDYGIHGFRWTEVNGSCSSSAEITVNFLQVPAANAGDDGAECDLDFVFSAVQGLGSGSWSKVSGPGSTVFSPNTILPNAKVTVDKYGAYQFAWREINSTCQSTDVVNVIFREKPAVYAGKDSVICKAGTAQFSATGTGTFLWEPTALMSNPAIQNPTAKPDTTTIFKVILTDQFGCKNTDEVKVEVWAKPSASAGPDKTLDYLFLTGMEAAVPVSTDIGTWSVVSGSGTFDNPNDPKSLVRNLSLEANILSWIVSNRVCPPAVDYVTITVNDLVIPTLITPNMDGQNDYFILRGLETLGTTELVVFDRRGKQVYKNTNYGNEWNGIDYNNQELPDDTYFFTLKTGNGKAISGYIVIRR